MIRAILFDLDGTLADTEPIHFAAFNEVLRSEGIAIAREEYFSQLIGYNDHDCFAAVLRENSQEHSAIASEPHLRELIARKTATYQDMIRDRDVMYPDAADFVRECGARFPLVIVTGTLRTEAEMILRRANLRELFVDIIAAEDVERGKPEPDGFIAALGRLGFLLRLRPPIDPSQALAIEDTAAGIEAAKRARMRVLALTQTSPETDLSAADLIRTSFRECDLDDILRRLSRVS